MIDGASVRSFIAGALLGTAACLPALQFDGDGNLLAWVAVAVLLVAGTRLHMTALARP